MIVRHRVADRVDWKPVFGERQGMRAQHSATSHVLYRDVDDPRAAMGKAGVQGPPDIRYIEELEEKGY
jgi:hypothetical protein